VGAALVLPLPICFPVVVCYSYMFIHQNSDIKHTSPQAERHTILFAVEPH